MASSSSSKLTPEQKARQDILLERMVKTIDSNMSKIDFEEDVINMYEYVEEEDCIKFKGSFSDNIPDNGTFHSV